MGLRAWGYFIPRRSQTLAAGAQASSCVLPELLRGRGSQWLAERLSGRRLPSLKGLPEGRLVVRWYAAVEVDRFLRDVARFARERAA
jgi:hypothetical protein